MTYYRVLPVGYSLYNVELWRWWWPFWITGTSYLDSREQAAEWIKGHSTYYDGAE